MHSFIAKNRMQGWPIFTLGSFLRFGSFPLQSTVKTFCSSSEATKCESIARLISNHPFPDSPLQPTLLDHITSRDLSARFVENVLGQLFGSHSNGLKAYEFFKFCMNRKSYSPSSDAFEKMLHILSRMRYFDEAWELLLKIKRDHPSLLSLKSMSILLSRFVKFRSYEDTVGAFSKMEKDIFTSSKFGREKFNVLLKAFCSQRRMAEAQSVFSTIHSQFSATTKTMNILLQGFKETGDITSVDLFYHDMVRRGFEPNHVTYGVRIDAYCKRGSFGEGLRLFREMEKKNIMPTLKTITTLIHGAGIARDGVRARDLFQQISDRGMQPDIGAYNALMSSFINCHDLNSALALIKEIEGKGIDLDHVTYHTIYHGLIRFNRFDDTCTLFAKMKESCFVPKMRTVVMLMKAFCSSRRLDLGLHLWRYLMDRGYCPHAHALDILATGLCSHRRVEEAFQCCIQTVDRGRHISHETYRMLQRFTVQNGTMMMQLSRLEDRMRRLHKVFPPTKGYAVLLN